jgi:ATP-dependent helicase/DNAse subunit B
MYLLSKYERFKDKKLHILGIYLQKVNMIALDNTIDLVAQREKAFRLQGYTISDMSLIPLLDPSYTSSDYIMSMNVTKAGQFGPYAKIVTEEEEEELIQLIDTFIHQTHQGVMNGEFPIAPKRIGKDDQSCTYCKYKDICFKTYKDYVYLEKKEFPKKEEN